MTCSFYIGDPVWSCLVGSSIYSGHAVSNLLTSQAAHGPTDESPGKQTKRLPVQDYILDILLRVSSNILILSGGARGERKGILLST